MTTTLTVRNEVHNDQQPSTNVFGRRFPAPLEAIATGAYRFLNRGGKVKLIFYMPATSTFDITVTSVPDPLGRSEDLVASGADAIATVGANPEIRVLGPFSPGLYNQKTGADKDYVLFSIANEVGAIKVAALYGS